MFTKLAMKDETLVYVCSEISIGLYVENVILRRKYMPGDFSTTHQFSCQWSFVAVPINSRHRSEVLFRLSSTSFTFVWYIRYCIFQTVNSGVKDWESDRWLQWRQGLWWDDMCKMKWIRRK